MRPDGRTFFLSIAAAPTALPGSGGTPGFETLRLDVTERRSGVRLRPRVALVNAKTCAPLV